MEILSREQFEENEQEENYKKITMSSFGDLLKNRFVKPKKNITDSKSALADEIFTFFNKGISYPLIRKWIKENGEQCLREVFEETKHKGIALFIWSVKKNRTQLKEIKE
jgi:hypothetical protein